MKDTPEMRNPGCLFMVRFNKNFVAKVIAKPYNVDRKVYEM
jgi:hypothetical protein